jgi:predicted short-subunit dehydrogenase-like oxidoreductase (DUF2520 family)
MEPIGIAGTGRVAQALGRLLAERGARVTAIAGRHLPHTRIAAKFVGSGAKPVALAALPSRATHILIAVSDNAIEEVARVLADSGMTSGIALHTCGTVGPEALAPLASAGVSCGSLHPLQTVATPEGGVAALPGSAFAIDGDGPALEWAAGIALLLGGEPLRIPPSRRPLYHAAAVMASNYVIALMDAAAMLMKAAGTGEEASLRAIGPLARTSVENALNLGPARALTGPIQRGDTETVASHLRALAGAPASVRGLYRSAGLHALDVAARRGLAQDRVDSIRRLLKGREGKNG